MVDSHVNDGDLVWVAVSGPGFNQITGVSNDWRRDIDIPDNRSDLQNDPGTQVRNARHRLKTSTNTKSKSRLIIEDVFRLSKHWILFSSGEE